MTTITKNINVIILNWNGLESTVSCLNSLLHYNNSNCNFIVIDNGSKKREDRELIRLYGNKIKVYRTRTNLGFTGGVNYGIKKTLNNKCEFFLLLNNDTVVPPETIKLLISKAKSDNKIGLVNPIVKHLKDEEVLFSGGKINWLTARPYRLTEINKSYDTEEHLTGCCLLIKRKLIEKIGYLDDIFFAYFEDTDYSLRAISAGFKCVVEPKALIFHNESFSSGKTSALYTYLFSRNRIIFIRKNAKKYLWIYYLLFFHIKLLVVTIYFLSTNQFKRIKPYRIGFIDGINNKGGVPIL